MFLFVILTLIRKNLPMILMETKFRLPKKGQEYSKLSDWFGVEFFFIKVRKGSTKKTCRILYVISRVEIITVIYMALLTWLSASIMRAITVTCYGSLLFFAAYRNEFFM